MLKHLYYIWRNKICISQIFTETLVAQVAPLSMSEPVVFTEIIMPTHNPYMYRFALRCNLTNGPKACLWFNGFQKGALTTFSGFHCCSKTEVEIVGHPVILSEDSSLTESFDIAESFWRFKQFLLNPISAGIKNSYCQPPTPIYVFNEGAPETDSFLRNGI